MHTHRPRTTLRGLVARTVARNLAWAAAVLASWSVVAGLVGPVVTGQPAPADEPRVDRVSALVARHDCWTGSAPARETEPRHAVVTLPDGRPRVVPAVRGYEIWLRGGAGVLHAFCP